jgi:hypothetical protein
VFAFGIVSQISCGSFEVAKERRGAMQRERVCRFEAASVRAHRDVSLNLRREGMGRVLRIWFRSSVGRLRRWHGIATSLGDVLRGRVEV